MLKRRKILLVLTLVLVAGSLGGTVAYALHLRSAGLRQRIAAGLSERMGLDVRIGNVVPLSFSSRRFETIAVWMPQASAQIGQCRTATWHVASAGEDAPRSLDISDGWLLLGTGAWVSDDYRRLLRSGFAHDFAGLGISEINVERIDFRWTHPAFSVTAPAACGAIYFDDQGRGRAALTVSRINDTPVEDPIVISAWFTPGQGMSFQRVEARIGHVPLRALALDRLAGGPVSQGAFRGQVDLRACGQSTWGLSVNGSLDGARLDDLTRQVIGGPFKGQVDVTIEDAGFELVERQRATLEFLRFRGRLENLQLGDFASVLREPALNGRVDLTVEQADYKRPDLKSARISGHAADVSLEALTRLLGYGVITGRLEIRINALAIVDNQVEWADLDLVAKPPETAPAYIEKSALARVGREVFKLDLEPLLPQRVEYVTLGVKLLLDREGLRVRGSHGKDNRTILTVKLLGREVAILNQPDRVYPVEDIMALLRQRLGSYQVDDLVEFWTSQAIEPGPTPRDPP